MMRMEIDFNNEDHLNNEKFTISSHKQIRPIVSKIRELVRKFRRSPTKILQKYVKLEHKKDFSLILDYQAPWNSLLSILERLFELRIT